MGTKIANHNPIGQSLFLLFDDFFKNKFYGLFYLILLG
jgi:hypothetical protein